MAFAWEGGGVSRRCVDTIKVVREGGREGEGVNSKSIACEAGRGIVE